MKRGLRFISTLLLAFVSVCLAQAQSTISPTTGDNICQLSTLDLSTVTYFNDNGKTAVRANKNTLNGKLVMKGTTYESGVGTHADSKFVAKVNGATKFHAIIGIDDGADLKDAHGIVNYTFTTYDANKVATQKASGTITRAEATATTIDIDLTGSVYLVINFDKGAQAWADHVDLGDAYFVFANTKPELIAESKMWVDDSKVINIPTAGPGLENIPLSSLDISKTISGWAGHNPKANKSIDGNDLKLNGYTYTSGVGTHGPSQIIIKLNGSVTDFRAVLGLDDETKTNGNFDYKVYVKGEDGNTKTLHSGTINASNRTANIDADVNGWKYLFLETTNGSDGNNGSDHVDWANAYLVFQDQNSTRPCIVSAEEISSKLACATTVFSQPGVRFMHKIRATNPNAKLSVSNLPAGLKWNAKRNIVEGIAGAEGKYKYNVNVEVDGETTTEEVGFTISKNLQHPVPFMGWLSWNAVQSEVSEAIVKKVVDLFIDKGLYECGWNTVMMDDWWHADSRAADGSPRPNPTRFPNGLEPVSKYVHDKGMKFGLYTDAAYKTCAGAFGSYGSETKDAQTYAKWGIDVVKCDYCNAPSDVESAKTRYKALADAFDKAGYGTMLYICEWGVREPWKWGAEVGGRCWRISQDVRDCWTGRGTGVGVVQSIRDMKNLSAYQGVNRFNDADMLCTALHAKGKSSNDLCGGTGAGMTQDEYRTQFALWCMWSSPMALSFDPRSEYITEDDYAIMKNKDLIALNQDRMGQQADLISETNDMVVFAKDCENGDIAISVTNMSSSDKDFTFDFNQIPALDPTAQYQARDLWEGKDLTDPVVGTLSTRVRTHATKVFRLSKCVGNIEIKSSTLWGTYFTDQAFVMPEGLTGCVVDGVQNGELHLDALYPAGSTVPASVGVLVHADEVGTYKCFAPAEEDVATQPTINYLKGTTAEQMIDGETGHVYYQLTNATIGETRTFGFFYGAENGAPFVNAAHKAYLDLTTDKAAEVQGFALPLDFTTGIADATTISYPSSLNIYNMSGVKLNARSTKALSKGVYVVNGKKVVVK